MSTKEVIDLIDEKKQALREDLEVVAITKELEISEKLQPEKIQAILTSAEVTQEIQSLENQINIMEVQVKANQKKEALQSKARELAVQLMSDEEKTRLYQAQRKKVEDHIAEIKARYGL